MNPIEINNTDDLDESISESAIPELEEESSELLLKEDNLGAAAYSLLPYVQNSLSLSNKAFEKLKHRLWCFSASLRQPRKDDGTCNKTPFFHRWNTNLTTSHLTQADPRYATEEECQKIFVTLLGNLLEAYSASVSEKARKIAEEILERPFQPNSLHCVETGNKISSEDIRQAMDYATAGLSSYEIPITYKIELSEGGYHIHSNVGWMKPIHITYKLRKHLRQSLRDAGVLSGAIKKALDKIQVKSYCTDKVTMPPHYSNRDVRWATWGDSIQYASHYECAMVELELMAQLYEFVDAPELGVDLFSDLAVEVEEVRGKPIKPNTHRCFVTGKYLSYSDYVDAAKKPKGGRSKYHVGHILPLTRGGRHTWDNIAWTSDDGNRIQGNDTQEEIEAKLVEAVTYHLQRDIELDNPPASLANRVERLGDAVDKIRERLRKPKSLL